MCSKAWNLLGVLNRALTLVFRRSLSVIYLYVVRLFFDGKAASKFNCWMPCVENEARALLPQLCQLHRGPDLSRSPRSTRAVRQISRQPQTVNFFHAVALPILVPTFFSGLFW